MSYFQIRIASLSDPATILASKDYERNTETGARKTAASSFMDTHIHAAGRSIHRHRVTILIREEPEDDWRLLCWRDGTGLWKYADKDWDIA